MRQRAMILVAAGLFACGITPAWANCAALPRSAQAYLKLHPGWAPVTEKDLVSDDVTLWQSHHVDQCPGITALKLDSSDRATYALALLHRETDRTNAKLVVVEPGTSQVTDLVAATPVTSPYVVWRAPPGMFRDQISGKSIRIPHDAIIYEKMEASAMAYYLAKGKFRS